MINEWLSHEIENERHFAVVRISSSKRTRTTQGTFALWQVTEYLGTIKQLWRALRTHRPKLVYMSVGKTILPFFRDSVLVGLCRIAGCRVATELAGERFAFLDGGCIGRKYGEFVLRRMASIRFLGSSIARRHADVGIRDIVVMDNGVEIPSCALTERASQETDIFTFLFVGVHSQRKGFDVLIQAACQLHAQSVDFRIVSMGRWESGAFRDKMVAALTAAGAEAALDTKGLCVGNDKWGAFRTADALVLPSLTEGQPLCILEAMAFGLPVIGTSVGAIPDIITDGRNGLLVQPDYVRGLASAMHRMVGDVALKQSASRLNKTLFHARFSIKRYAQNTTEWLLGVAAHEPKNAREGGAKCTN